MLAACEGENQPQLSSPEHSAAAGTGVGAPATDSSVTAEVASILVRLEQGLGAKQLGDPCLASDGWQPEPIAGCEPQPEGADPVLCSIPEGYIDQPDKLGPGVVYCLEGSNFPVGYLTSTCTEDAHCGESARCDCIGGGAECGSGRCRRVCSSHAECTAPLRCQPVSDFHACNCSECGLIGAPPLDLASNSDACAADCSDFCCDGVCTRLRYDHRHCGGCNTACNPGTACLDTQCETPTCMTTCDSGTCCGASCCGETEACCFIATVGAGSEIWGCIDAATESCPIPYFGMCNSPDTPIATADGDVPIASLKPGDWVYSVRGRATALVPVLRVGRHPVHDHEVIRVAFANGRVLEVSGAHPLGDGRTFADLVPGMSVDGVHLVTVERIPYTHPFTYDILPASDTGHYFAAGFELASTMR